MQRINMRIDNPDQEGEENAQHYVGWLSGGKVTSANFRFSDESRTSIFNVLSKMKSAPENGAQASFLIVLEKELRPFAILKKQQKDARNEANVIDQLKRLSNEVKRFETELKNALSNPTITSRIACFRQPMTKQEMAEQIERGEFPSTLTVEDELQWIQEYLTADINPSIQRAIDEYEKKSPPTKPKEEFRAFVIRRVADLLMEHLNVKATTTHDGPFEQLIRVLLPELGWKDVEDLHKVILSVLKQKKVQKPPENN